MKRSNSTDLFVHSRFHPALPTKPVPILHEAPAVCTEMPSRIDLSLPLLEPR